MTTNFYSPLDSGSRMGKNHDPVSGKTSRIRNTAEKRTHKKRTICAQSRDQITREKKSNFEF
jgi:hypothetical protein